MSLPTDKDRDDYEDRKGSEYDYVADEGEYSYYNAGSNDNSKVTSPSTTTTTKATPQTTTKTATSRTSTTTITSRRTQQATASPSSPTSTATYVGDYEEVDSHIARKELDICGGVVDR